jgi:SulP family sulfate permease
VFGNQVDWHVIAMSAAEIGSFCGVMAIALLLDVTSLEVARQKTADLDQEFRSNGLANLLASVFGGFGGSLSMNGCVLLDESGATTRWSGAVIGIAAAFILVSGFDVGAIVPKALLGGMLAYLGAVIIVELFATPTRSSWMEWALTGLMTLVIINFGYFMGVVVGVVGACLLFAVSYSRIGVIRRHLTRYEFSSNVERSPEQARLLHDQGKRVHVFWLSGFIFFGSSNGLFERIKGTIEDQQDTPVNYVVLDFSAVQGLDTSAVLSLIKLRNYCEEHGVVIAFSGLDENMRAGFDRAGFFGNDKPHQAFGSRNEAVEWCEDMLLMHHEVGDASTHSFESWIQKELGEQFDISRISPYMKLEELKPGEFLFRQGEPSDSIAFQTSGSVAITIQDEHGRPIRLRRMLGHTVVGEMGFFRKVPRAASIIAEGPTVVYRLTRESFDKMQQEDPTAAAALHKLIIRLLSDRLEFANREISALI